MRELEQIQPGLVLRDHYGNEQTYYPPGWMYVLAFALAGCQWAVDEVNSGKLDAYLWLGDGI